MKKYPCSVEPYGTYLEQPKILRKSRQIVTIRDQGMMNFN